MINFETDMTDPPEKAEFIRPPNLLKAKVGSGGLAPDVLEKAQELLETHNIEFAPLAELYLRSLLGAIESSKSVKTLKDSEYAIVTILYPTTQLRANGAMFKYPVVSQIARKLTDFLGKVEFLDESALKIVSAFHSSLHVVIASKLSGDGGREGYDLIVALEHACQRYFNALK